MKGVCVAAAIAALCVTPSIAAEPMFVAPALPAPAFEPAPAFNWSGFYIGANAGYAWGDATVSALGLTESSDYDGWAGGGQVGFNWQLAAFLLGFEADVQLTGIGHAESALGITSSDLNWFSTVRARAGVPLDSVLPYLTGGLAFGSNEIEATSIVPGSLSESNTHVGWTIGAGVEVALNPQWSVKGEYLFVDLGEQTYFSDRVTDGVKADVDFHLLRLGVNYRIPLF